MRIVRRTLINAIAFGIASVGLFALLAIRVLPTVFGDSYSIYAVFPEAGGVFTNQEVTYRGVQVGRVGTMTLTEDAVRIELQIEQRFQIPSSDTTARIMYKSAVGEQFVNLIPKKATQPFFADGDTIPIERTSIPVQSEDLLRELNAVLESVDPSQLGSLIHELGVGLKGHGSDLKELLLALDTLAAIGASHAAEIQTGITSAAGLQDAFNSSRSDFISASGSLTQVSAVLVQRRAELEKTLDQTRALDRELLLLLKNRKVEIENLVGDLGTVTRITHAQLSDLDLVLRYLGPFLGDVHRAYVAPYFIFNVIADSSGPPCSYAPTNRPERAITTKDNEGDGRPDTTFNCDPEPAGATSATQIARSKAGVSQIRPSWLRLYEVNADG